MSQRAQESLSALRTVQTFNARTWEEGQFKTKVHQVLDLGKKEALASGIFFGTLAFFLSYSRLVLSYFLFWLRRDVCQAHTDPMNLLAYRVFWLGW